MQAGAIDLAFVRPPIGDHRGLVLEPLLEEDMLVVLPAGHPLLVLPSVPLAELAKETFILFPRALSPGFHDSITEACRRAGFAPIRGQDTPDVVTGVLMVSTGFGITVVPRCVSRIHVDGTGYVPVEADGLRAPICLAYRRDDGSPAVRNFVAVARRLARTVASASESTKIPIMPRAPSKTRAIAKKHSFDRYQ